MVVAGRFRVGRLLHQNASGARYGARDLQGRADATIHVYPEATGLGAHGRAERRMRILRGLAHPGVQALLATERGEGGRWVVVTESLPGGSLLDRMAHGPGALAGPRARHLLRSLLETLAYLHGQGPAVVHGAIQPAHIMFRSTDALDPVLTDFVIDGLSQDGGPGVGGTRYTPPEQLGREGSPTADLYAVGATMLHVLTGHSPDAIEWGAEAPRDPSLLAHVDPAVRRCVVKLAQPSRFHRYGSPEEALEDLGKAAPVVVAMPGQRRHRLVVFSIALSMMVFGLVAAVLLQSSVQESSHPVTARRGLEPADMLEGERLDPVAMATEAPEPPQAEEPPAEQGADPAPPALAAEGPEDEPEHLEPRRQEPKAPKARPPSPVREEAPKRPRPASPKAAPPPRGGASPAQLARLSPHIQEVRMASGAGIRTPRVVLKATTTEAQAMDAALRVLRAHLAHSPPPSELIGRRSGYAAVYVDLPPELFTGRQRLEPFVLRQLAIRGTRHGKSGFEGAFGAPYLLMASEVHERNETPTCCRSRQIGTIQGQEVVLH
jgi:serine/threonine protein kinase